MVEDDISKLHIDKKGMAVRRGRKKRLLLLVLLLVVVAGGGVLYNKGLLTPALTVQVAGLQSTYRPRRSRSQRQRLCGRAKKGCRVLQDHGPADFLVGRGRKPVKKGEVIATLENEDSQAALNRAQANVNLARSTLDQAKAELEDAQINHIEMNSWLPRALSHSPPLMLLKQDTSGQRRLSLPRSSDPCQQAAREEAKVLVEYSNIRAPFDAVVLTKNADIGDIVTPLGAAANAKAAVVTIADMGSLQVEVDVSESNISQVRVGQPCEIRLDAFPDLRFKGRST